MDKDKKQENAMVAAKMQMNGGGLILRSAEDLKLIAELFSKADFIPRCFNTPAKLAVAVEAGAELGFKPWQSIQNLHVVNGQIGIKSTAIGGLIRNSGKCKFLKQEYNDLGNDDFAALIKSQRTDDPTVHETEFSVADAKSAGLWGKDNWKHYPKDMLMWRALSRHGRQFYGDVLSGFYSIDELQEITPPEAQLGPEAPGREARRLEDVKITDTKATVGELVEQCLAEFVKQVKEKLEVDLGADTGYYFTQFAGHILGGEVDHWKDDKSYTIENANQLLGELQVNGVPQPILDMIPHAMSEAEVDKHSEDKFGGSQKDGLWHCAVCKKDFDVPKRGPKDIPLCHFCLSDKVEILEPDNVN